MKGKSIFDYENPVTGKTDNLLNLRGLAAKVLGVTILFIVVAAGQNFARKLSSKVPAIDTTIDPITQSPKSESLEVY